MASNAAVGEWSRLPEPLPAASGILVPLFRAATVYKLDQALETSRVSHRALTTDTASRRSEKMDP